MRFFLSAPLFSEPELFLRTVKNEKKDGTMMEGRRSGGSNGKLQFTKAFFDFLKIPGILPRQRQGTVIIPDTLGIHCYWITPYQKKKTVCYQFYAQPQKGGQCNMFTKKILQDFPKIKVFAASKLVAALICKHMKNVSEEAVENEINVVTDTDAFGGSLDEYVQKGCNFTVVRHAVGYHNDVGNKGLTSFFENRVVLRSAKYKSKGAQYRPHGRGGGENGEETYALLDWPKDKKK